MLPDRSVADRLCAFIDASPSPYHAVAAAATLLDEAGFVEVDLRDELDRPGPHLCRIGGALLAWVRPPRPEEVRLIGAHTDSPNLRLRPKPDHARAGIAQLGVEVYGGALWNSWLDRDLGLSGRLATADGEEVLVQVDEPLLRIPQLAIHLDREVNTAGLRLDPQRHLQPMWALGDDVPTLRDYIAGRADLDPAAIVAWDLMLHDVNPSTRSGLDSALVSAPRLDNLASCFAAVRALAAFGSNSTAPIDGILPFVCLYDHEEVGSLSATGADSSMVASVLERVIAANRAEFLQILATSMCLSADMAHATNPNHVDRHEPDHHISLNGGVVVKTNANQRYATDARSQARIRHRLASTGPIQDFVSRNDVPCGSTIGPVTAGRLGMATLDVGIAQLAMHSAREMIGADDPWHYEQAMGAFLAP